MSVCPGRVHAAASSLGCVASPAIRACAPQAIADPSAPRRVSRDRRRMADRDGPRLSRGTPGGCGPSPDRRALEAGLHPGCPPASTWATDVALQSRARPVRRSPRRTGKTRGCAKSCDSSRALTASVTSSTLWPTSCRGSWKPFRKPRTGARFRVLAGCPWPPCSRKIGPFGRSRHGRQLVTLAGLHPSRREWRAHRSHADHETRTGTIAGRRLPGHMVVVAAHPPDQSARRAPHAASDTATALAAGVRRG